jgi:hypothetical protein
VGLDDGAKSLEVETAMADAPEVTAQRQLALFDAVELAPGLVLRAGPSTDATTTAAALLGSLIDGSWLLLDEQAVANELGWDVIVFELASETRAGALRAFVVKLILGPKAAWVAGTLPDGDPAYAARRAAVLAYAARAVPAWSGSATLEDLLWLPDDGAIPPQWK